MKEKTLPAEVWNLRREWFCFGTKAKTLRA